VKGRLNLFQASMLRWRELHPYTAIHAVRVERALDAARLTAGIDAQLEALGLTGFALDVRRRRYEYAGGPAHTRLAVHSGGSHPIGALEQTIERALNEPFARDGRLDPFRFFCIDNGAWFHLGLAYDHVVAGGDSIVVLMAGIVARYSGDPPAAPRRGSLERYPATCARLFLRHAGSALTGLRFLPGMAASCRRTVRPRYPRGDDPRNGFAYRRLDSPRVTGLVATARSWGVSVNDLSLAIVLDAMAPLAGDRPPVARRHELAVASIVNLRREFQSDPNTTFGQFLSAFRVSHPVPAGIPLRQLAREVHADTARVKAGKLYLQSLLGIAMSGVLWRFLSGTQRARFYAKNYPTWGAITPVNVDAHWAGAGGRMPPPEYMRAVSTGPLAPIVVAVTTAADVLHAGISYRTAAFTPAEAARLADAIIAGFQHLES
jgi:hypothetical protein